jgi:hypothetical protein
MITDIVLTRQPGRPENLSILVIADGESYFGSYAGGDSHINMSPTDELAPGAMSIVSSPTVITTADGRIVFAGADASGDLVIYYHTSPIDPANPLAVSWGFGNLTDDHITARGQEFTPVASNLTGLSTPWGTDHLAYLDADGEVHVVWWAPGDPLWRTDQLSRAEESGALSGKVTSFTTSWRALHINAFDADGEVVAVWWAPGHGGDWRTDHLAAPGDAKLDPATVSSFSTPWNALNIVGLDAQTGAPTVYWWAPATQRWSVEPIQLEGAPPQDLSLTGSVAAAISPDGTQNLFARRDNGTAMRLHWSVGGGTMWGHQDLTRMIA